MEPKYISVAALNRYIQYKLEQDIHLQQVYIRAEISNLRLSKNILYFVLKDDEAEIDALMFSSAYAKLSFEPLDGMTVLVYGKVGVYPKRGKYSISVFTMEQAGLGNAYLQFIQLKEKLEKEGLFDEKQKLSLPNMPEKIGVITSATGDAINDILSTIQKRFPLAAVYLYPALVQGADAPKSIIQALQRANQDQLAEVLILARGGGSMEDLSCFNDEELARVIFKSRIPTVSGVGHESDYTICDFIASRRAPTPTGAAVLVTPDRMDLIKDIETFQKRIVSSVKQKLITSYNQLQHATESYGIKQFMQIVERWENRFLQTQHRLQQASPKQKIGEWENAVNQFSQSLQSSALQKITVENQKIENVIEKLILLNPLHILNKGYALTYQNGKMISSVKQIEKEQNLLVQYSDGQVETKIEYIKYEKL